MIDYTKSFVKDKGSFDEGLRNYMLKIYNFMAIGLLVTGVFAFSTLNFPPLASLMFNIGPNGEFMGTSGLGMLISFAPLGIAIYFFMGLGRMSVNTAQTLFWVYAAVMGMSLSYLGLVYTGQSLARTFFICASVFVSIYENASMLVYLYYIQLDIKHPFINLIIIYLYFSQEHNQNHMVLLCPIVDLMFLLFYLNVVFYP